MIASLDVVLRMNTATFALQSNRAKGIRASEASKPLFRVTAPLGMVAALLASALGIRLCAEEPVPSKGEKPVKANHWAFGAPVRPPLPVTKASAPIRNPIDQFVLARLE